MKHRQKSRAWEIAEILLSFLVMASAVILVLDWKTHEYFFVIAFGAASLLFLTRGIRTISAERGHIAGGILYLAGAAVMIGFLVGSILTIWGGNL